MSTSDRPVPEDELATFRAAVSELEGQLPISSVTVYPSGSASTDSEWAATVTISLEDGRELLHHGGSWTAPDESLLEANIAQLDAVTEAADIAMWGAMSEAAERAAHVLSSQPT